MLYSSVTIKKLYPRARKSLGLKILMDKDTYMYTMATRRKAAGQRKANVYTSQTSTSLARSPRPLARPNFTSDLVPPVLK